MHPIASAIVRGENSVNTDRSYPCWILWFCGSYYTILETNMPMFQSTSGGKSGAASAPEMEDAIALKGAKSKEDADSGAACPNPHNDESTLRETSPQ